MNYKLLVISVLGFSLLLGCSAANTENSNSAEEPGQGQKYELEEQLIEAQATIEYLNDKIDDLNVQNERLSTALIEKSNESQDRIQIYGEML